MDKVKVLCEKAQSFRALLEGHARDNMDANLLLTWLTPLFKDIEDGKVISSCYYEYRVALGKDSPFYEPSSPFFSAESAFVCALEDWVSQAWYQEGKRRADEKEK